MKRARQLISRLTLLALGALLFGVLSASVVTAQAVDEPTSQTIPQQTETQTQGSGLSGTSTTADNICKGILSAETGNIPPGTTIENCQETGDDSFSFLVRRIINIFSIVVGAVSVIMIIIGGFRYIISGGDSSGVSNAKNTILYAIVGLVIVLFAQVIIRFILTNAAPNGS